MEYDPYSTAGYGIGVPLLVFVLSWFLVGRTQFPGEVFWQFIVATSLTIFFIGMGGMDWLTYGEFQFVNPFGHQSEMSNPISPHYEKWR